MLELSALIDTVQKNCTIADARHARDITMCTFLLEMREYYRWEMEIPYGARLPRDELGDWLNARESLWDTVEEEDFAPLPLNATGIDPFEADDINRALIPLGLVYSSGLGHFRKPHFVLAELKRAEMRDGVQVLVAGCEYARYLIAPPPPCATAPSSCAWTQCAACCGTSTRNGSGRKRKPRWAARLPIMISSATSSAGLTAWPKPRARR